MLAMQKLAIISLLALTAGAVSAVAAPQSAEGGSHAFAFSTAGGSYIGVFVAEVDTDRAKALKLPEERGVEITRVEPDSPADKAGLKVGDVVLSYDGQNIEGMEQFRRMIRETPVGRHAVLGIFRNGAPQNLTVVIGAMKPHVFTMPGPGQLEINPSEGGPPEVVVPDLPKIFPGAKSVVLGVETEPLSQQLAQYFGVDRGVLIRTVLPGTPAEKAGLHAGDVVTKADDVEITSPGKLSVAVRAAFADHRALTLRVVRNKAAITMTIPLEQEQGRGTVPSGHVVKSPGH